MDEMRERESCAPERERERERELRVKYREERKKIVKKLYTHATVLQQLIFIHKFTPTYISVFLLKLCKICYFFACWCGCSNTTLQHDDIKKYYFLLSNFNYPFFLLFNLFFVFDSNAKSMALVFPKKKKNKRSMALVPPQLPFSLSPNPFLLRLKLNPSQSFMAISSSWHHRCCRHSWQIGRAHV